MRRLWIFILFFAFGCQQTPFLESENLKTSESEKGCELRAMSNEQKSPNAQSSKLKAQSPSQVFNFSDSKKSSQVFSFSDSQILYFENQIRLADSLYKNYLPQSNFEEVKKAMEFFDSVQLLAISRQRRGLFDKKADNENMLIAESLLPHTEYLS